MNKTKLLISIVFGIVIIFFSIKFYEHKSSFIIDSDIIGCYDKCVNIPKELKKTISIREIDIFNYASFIEELQYSEKKRIEAELEEKERLAALEKKRIVYQQKKQEEKKKKQVVVSRGEVAKPKWIVFEASYYTAFCDTGCTGVTALGWDVSNTIHHNGLRVIAVDPKIIPLGSIVEISTPNETFKAIAGDTGGAIKGYKVDILVDSKKKAVQLGRHRIQLRILK